MNVVLELALVAGAIANAEHAWELLDEAPRGSLTDPNLGVVWGVVADLADKGQRPELGRVQAELVRAGLVERIGAEALQDLAKGGALAHVRRAATLVRAAADKRRFEALAKGVLEDMGGLTSPDSVLQALPMWQAFLDEALRSSGPKAARRMDMADGVLASLQRAQARARGDEPERVWSLGVLGVDEHWQLAPNELVILGAGSGVGKSAFSQWVSTRYVYSTGRGALFLPLADLDGPALADRELSHLSQRRGWEVSREKPSREGLDAMAKAVERDTPWLKGRFVVTQPPSRLVEDTVMAIRRERLRMAAGGVQLGLVVVDYAQALTCRGHERLDSMEILARVSGALKDMAEELDLCIIMPSQYNRGYMPGGRPPQTADLFGGSAMEFNADVVILLHSVRLKLPKTDMMRNRLKKVIAYCRKYRAGPQFELGFISDLSTYSYWPESNCPHYIPPPPKKKGTDDDDDDE